MLMNPQQKIYLQIQINSIIVHLWYGVNINSPTMNLVIVPLIYVYSIRISRQYSMDFESWNPLNIQLEDPHNNK